MRLRAVIALLATLALAGALSGCDLFEPATPETGAGGPDIAIDLSDPDSTLVTMARAMQEKAEGLTAYMQTLSDPVTDGAAFRATFDAAVASQFPNPPAVWSNDLERAFYGYFIDYRPADRYRLLWEVDEENPDDPSATPRVLHRRYQVLALSSSSPPDTTRIAVGFATLTFANVSGRYVITTWDDRYDPSVGVNPADPDDRSFSWRRLESR
jgi:hypothetical protein